MPSGCTVNNSLDAIERHIGVPRSRGSRHQQTLAGGHHPALRRACRCALIGLARRILLLATLMSAPKVERTRALCARVCGNDTSRAVLSADTAGSIPR